MLEILTSCKKQMLRRKSRIRLSAKARSVLVLGIHFSFIQKKIHITFYKLMTYSQRTINYINRLFF